MPVFYRILPTTALIYAAGFGHCTDIDFLNAQEAAWLDPLRQPGMMVIIDLHNITELDLQFQDNQRAFELSRKIALYDQTPVKTVVLVRNHFDIVTIDTLALFAEPIVSLKLTAFRTLDAALDWLELTPQATLIVATRDQLEAEYRAQPLAR